MLNDTFSLKVDGVEIPCPSSFQFGVMDVSAAESGRTSDAVMHKNRVAQKRKIELAWAYPDFETVHKIMAAFNPEYISVTYPDALTGNIAETRTFYVGDREAPLKYWWVGKQLYESLSFNIIER